MDSCGGLVHWPWLHVLMTIHDGRLTIYDTSHVLVYWYTPAYQVNFCDSNFGKQTQLLDSHNKPLPIILFSDSRPIMLFNSPIMLLISPQKFYIPQLKI